MRIWQFLGDSMVQIRQVSTYRDVRKNYCFENKKIVQNNLSICQFERKDNKINAYLSKILPNCLTFHISQSVRYVRTRARKQNETNFRRLRTNFKRYPRSCIAGAKTITNQSSEKTNKTKKYCCQSDIYKDTNTHANTRTDANSKNISLSGFHI